MVKHLTLHVKFFLVTCMKIKQVIVVRSDLKMSRGKVAAQVAHAAVSAAENSRIHFPNWWRAWLVQGQKKVVLRVEGGDELIKIFSVARQSNLPVSLIADRGLTELRPGTLTCIGIGPAPERLIDRVTGKLPLL